MRSKPMKVVMVAFIVISVLMIVPVLSLTATTGDQAQAVFYVA